MSSTSDSSAAARAVGGESTGDIATAAVEIRTTPRPNCPLCGAEGEFRYQGLSDRLFGASGLWDIKSCTGDGCDLLWLDPMPTPEDIGKAYLHYYTHSAGADAQSVGALRRLLRQMKRSYHAEVYGYESDLGPRADWTMCAGLRLFPLHREAADHEVRFLHARPGGRLLDVGCGSGAWLTAMHARGWSAEGVELDRDAVDVARAAGLDVRHGDLEQQHYPTGSFDAVTLCHVIEHLPGPQSTIAECLRVLSPGGTLVIATPNSASLSHRLYGKDWRGLEPPRHLSMFSMQSLNRVLLNAGFDRVALHPQRAHQVIYESALLRRGLADYAKRPPHDRLAASIATLFCALELPLIGATPHIADCVTAVAWKR